MIIINGQVYYYDGFEYVPAGMTEAEYFNQFTNQSGKTGNKKSLNDIVE